MYLNWPVLLIASLIPLVVGAFWYSKKVFGSAWSKTSTMQMPETGHKNIGKLYVLTFILSFLITIPLMNIVIHQNGLYSLLMNVEGIHDPNSDISQWLTAFMETHGRNFRTFGHGAFHGTLTGMFLVLPVIAINSLFENKGAKYIFINAGYWILSLALMGGIICAYH